MVTTVTCSPAAPAVSEATSSAVSARRASPAESCTSNSTASSVTSTWPARPRGSSMARRTTVCTAAASSGCSCRISDRDQQHDPVLDGREQRVLLGLGKPVHLVDEQHGLLTVLEERDACLLYDGADLLDARRQRRQRLEPAAGRLRDQRRQR